MSEDSITLPIEVTEKGYTALWVSGGHVTDNHFRNWYECLLVVRGDGSRPQAIYTRRQRHINRDGMFRKQALIALKPRDFIIEAIVQVGQVVSFNLYNIEEIPKAGVPHVVACDADDYFFTEDLKAYVIEQSYKKNWRPVFCTEKGAKIENEIHIDCKPLGFVPFIWYGMEVPEGWSIIQKPISIFNNKTNEYLDPNANYTLIGKDDVVMVYRYNTISRSRNLLMWGNYSLHKLTNVYTPDVIY